MPNGRLHPESGFKEFGRIKTIRLCHNNQPLCTIRLADTRRWRQVTFPDVYLNVGDTLAIEVLDTYPGKNEQTAAINSAGPLMRLYVVATDFDPEIARSALDNYEPAEPLSLGALAAGGIAALCGWLATRLVAWPFSRSSRRRARPA